MHSIECEIAIRWITYNLHVIFLSHLRFATCHLGIKCVKIKHIFTLHTCEHLKKPKAKSTVTHQYSDNNLAQHFVLCKCIAAQSHALCICEHIGRSVCVNKIQNDRCWAQHTARHSIAKAYTDFGNRESERDGEKERSNKMYWHILKLENFFFHFYFSSFHRLFIKENNNSNNKSEHTSTRVFVYICACLLALTNKFDTNIKLFTYIY